MARDVAWYQKLGCDQDPFSPNPAVDRLYFETPVLASHLNTLTSVASKGELIGLVKGDRGIGKTSLLNQIARRFRDDPDVAFTRVTCTEGCSLIQSLGISSGLTEEELAVEPRKVLIEHLTRLRTGGQKVIAAIDDAHLLSPQDLAMLIRIGLSPNASGLVHTILFAEADIEARLWLSAISDPLPLDRLYTLTLTPFSTEQTQAYLSHRLAVAGLDKISFGGAEAAAIHRRSEGLPAAINEQASQRLERRYGPVWGRGVGVLPGFRPAWAAGLAGIAVIAGLGVWQREPLTQWVQSLDIQLPFPSDPQGTEVAIAIPGQLAEKPAEAIETAPKPVTPIEAPSLDEPSPDGSEEPTDVAGTTLAGTPDAEEDASPPEGSMASTDSDTTTIEDTPRLAQMDDVGPSGADNDAVEVSTLSSDLLPLPDGIQQRLVERAANEPVASTETTPVEPVEEPPVTATSETPEVAPNPSLSLPPELTGSPRLAGLSVEGLVSPSTDPAPITPETPTTPITGRSSTDASAESAEELTHEPPVAATSPVKPRPRPEAPPAADPLESGSEATTVAVEETVVTSTVTEPPPESTPVAPSTQVRDIPRPRPRPEPPPISRVAAVETPAADVESAPQETAPPPAPADAPSPFAEVRREDWFRQRSPGEYVIQLLVSSEEKKLQSYIASQRFPAPPAYYERSGKGTYVLVLGPYADQREARQAISGLSRNLRRNEPWVRSMASVQQELP